MVHGGFWAAEWDRAHAAPQSDGLAEAGYVVATVEYRRVGAGGGWPGTFDDVALLTDTVPGLVREAVGDRVDVDRTVLVGHSAGGHLAAWAAARHRLPAESPWHRPTAARDRRASCRWPASWTWSSPSGSASAATRPRGCSAAAPASSPERYAAASPAALLPTGVRTVLVHGDRDDEVPVEVSRSYVARGRRCR